MTLPVVGTKTTPCSPIPAMGQDVPTVPRDRALWAAPCSGSRVRDSQYHSVTRAAPGLLPHQCLLCHGPPVPLWGPWRDTDLPMAAAFEATQRYKSS